MTRLEPRSRRYRVALGDARIDIEAQGPRSLRLTDWLVGHLAVSPKPLADRDDAADFLVRDARTASTLSIYAGTELVHVGDNPAQTAAVVLSLVCGDLAGRDAGGLVFHAAAVSRDGHGLLLPGQPGSGKTTVALGLAMRGYAYLTDELALVPDGTPAVTGLRRPLNVRSASRFVWSSLVIQDASDVMGGPDFDLLHPRLFGRTDQAPVPMRAIVLPQYAAGAAPQLQPLSPAQAAFEMVGSVTNRASTPEHALADVGRLAARVPAWRMTYSDIGQVEGLLRPALDQAARAGNMS